MRDVLLRLVGMGAGGEVERRRVEARSVRRRRRWGRARAGAVYRSEGLPTVSAGSIEVAHEALLREWPRLCRLDGGESREELRIERELGDASVAWRRAGRDEERVVSRRGASPKPCAGARPGDERAGGPACLSSSRRASAAGCARTGSGAGASVSPSSGLGTVVSAIVAVALILVFAGRERDVAASHDLAETSAG